ncbi:hypothetical protein C4D60_Mb06t23920 [Musa balbisiana]|uniref:Uncharacterized protein n=1 Tax=Musa balbisiana TaxID=52838 RepID=A0A4S8IQY1_MUSBA|nr:hypothetical protein C4D60_Mb06t23920 [Musa balbisiana]
MEAIFCLPSALSAPYEGPGHFLLHRPTRNHALLARIRFPRSRPRPLTVSFSHVPPPSPRPEEDKGRARRARPWKGEAVGAAVVAAVACALGAVYMSRGAPVAGGPGSAMAEVTAGGDGKSVTMTAANTGCSRWGVADHKCGDVGTGVQKTPNMDQSTQSKKPQKISEIFSSKWLSGDEKHEVGITLAQVYIDLKNYRMAKEVCELIYGDLQRDSRPPLLMVGSVSHLRKLLSLEAVIHMMLAVETMLSMNTVCDDPEVKKLITGAMDYWEKYKELESGGFGSQPPKPE